MLTLSDMCCCVCVFAEHSEARQASSDYDKESDDRLVKAAYDFNLLFAHPLLRTLQARVAAVEMEAVAASVVVVMMVMVTMTVTAAMVAVMVAAMVAVMVATHYPHRLQEPTLVAASDRPLLPPSSLPNSQTWASPRAKVGGMGTVSQ